MKRDDLVKLDNYVNNLEELLRKLENSFNARNYKEAEKLKSEITNIQKKIDGLIK